MKSFHEHFDEPRRALAIALSSTMPSARGMISNTVPISDIFWGIAETTKCIGLLRLADPSLAKTDSVVAERFKQDQIETLRSNLAQLAETMACQSLLTENGISSLAFKGVVRQQQLYHRPDVRRSSDIDFLVSPTEYPRACSLLAASGYRPGVHTNNRWWHQCLGESPYLPTLPRRFIVDLHHQLQQPGGPVPRYPAELFRMSTKIDFGGGSITTLEPQAGLLVTVISYSKAVRDLTPWVVYAHEIKVAREAFTPADYKAFLALAASQGLLRLAEDAFHKADVFWRSLACLASSETLNPSDAAVVLSALGSSPRQLFRRTLLRWTWADGSVVHRTTRALHMALSEYRSNHIRRLEERPSRLTG